MKGGWLKRGRPLVNNRHEESTISTHLQLKYPCFTFFVNLCFNWFLWSLIFHFTHQKKFPLNLMRTSLGAETWARHQVSWGDQSFMVCPHGSSSEVGTMRMHFCSYFCGEPKFKKMLFYINTNNDHCLYRSYLSLECTLYSQSLDGFLSLLTNMINPKHIPSISNGFHI